MNKNHVVFHGSVNSTSLSAAAHAGGGVHEAGLQLVAQTQAHGRTQRDTVDGVRRDGHFHLQLLAEVLRQAVELCAAAGEDDAVAVDVAGQLRGSLLQHRWAAVPICSLRRMTGS